MSYDPNSPSDRADMEPDVPATCEWCDEVLDQSDMDSEAFSAFGGFICQSCAKEQRRLAAPFADDGLIYLKERDHG